MNLYLLVTLSIFLISLVSSQTPTNSISCPMNFDYVVRIPWPTVDCRHSADSTKSLSNSTGCCQTLLTVYGISLAQHLKTSSQFNLPDLATSSACLSDFQTKLDSLSLPNNLASFCFNPVQFVISSNTCAAIQNVEDWHRKLGNNTVLDSSCRSDLTDLTACAACIDAGLRVHSELNSIDGNASHSQDCFYFAVLYAAGVANQFGPESDGAVSCTFGITVLTKTHKNKHSSLVFGLAGGLVAVVVTTFSVGAYFWWDRRRKREKIDESRVGEFESGRVRRRPNTGSIWFKLHELEKATDNFSQKNFIGRGGFGVVYKGVLPDGSVVAVKKIIESEFEGNDEFCNEVEIISNLRHRNLVPLKGCCIHGEDEGYERRDDQRYLVYEYMSNGNLDDHLFPTTSRRPQLTWPQRKNIILDVAKGLAYLHYGVKPAIYHRDIKVDQLQLPAAFPKMVGGKWWCFGNRSSGDDVGDLDPIVLVSGIGGTILNSKPKSWFGITTRVWVRILLADLEFRKRVWSLYNPETGYTEALDDSSDLVIPQDDYGLYAIDILDPSLLIKLLHLTDVYHFHDMIDMLVNHGYKKGTTLFGYGYDFRQSNRIEQLIDGLKEKLETAYTASGGRKVNLISHSMGGLLVSCFISLHSDVFAKYVNKWITIATPFQGAPGCINDSLLTGLQFVEGLQSYFFVGRWSMHQLLVQCPSIYEMLPNPEFKWKKQPEILVWKKDIENGEDSVKLETYGTSGSVGLFEEALKDNVIEYNKKTIPLPFNYDIYKWAATTRKMLNSVQLPQGIEFYNIYGTSLDTPFDVCYGSEMDPINDPTDICSTLPEYSYVDGDGTVPAESAMADGFDAKERAGIPGAHRALLRDELVFEYIRKWLGIQEPSISRVKTSKIVDVGSA